MRTYYNSCLVMHTRLEAVFPGLDETTGEVVFRAMQRAMTEKERLLSAYDPEAEVYALNQQAVGVPIRVSDELWKILVWAKELCERSLGYFDAGVFRRVASEKCGLADEKTITGLQHLFLNQEKQEAAFAAPIALDTGGFGKGYGLRALYPVLDQYRVETAFISFGGSSVLTRGRHPHGAYWPYRLQESEVVFQLADACMSVSETTTVRNGQERYHLFNPKTGEMERRKRLAAVQHRDPVEAEVLSTALLLASQEEYETLIDNFKPERAVIVDREAGKIWDSRADWD